MEIGVGLIFAVLPVLLLVPLYGFTQCFQKVVILSDRFINQVQNLIPNVVNLSIIRVFAPGSLAVQHNRHILPLDLQGFDLLTSHTL